MNASFLSMAMVGTLKAEPAWMKGIHPEPGPFAADQPGCRRHTGDLQDRRKNTERAQGKLSLGFGS